MSFDIKSIKKDFKKVVDFALLGDYEEINSNSLNTMFDMWLKNKQFFIDRFGGDTMFYDVPKTFELSTTQKKQIYRYFLGDIIDVFYEKITNSEKRDECLNKVNNFFNKCVNFNDFFKNSLPIDLFIGGVKIQKGTKITKVIGILLNTIEGIDNKNLQYIINDIQCLYSERLQQNKLHGRLVLSVHPLDFLSASETTYDWRSCHSLDGEYAMGNLQFMVDDCTFMVYLLSDKGNPKVLPNFPNSVLWNSKKWRNYLFLDLQDDVVMRGNSYPFTSESILDRVGELLQQLGIVHVGTRSWKTYKDSEIDVERFYNDKMKTRLYYNDLNDHSTYRRQGYISAYSKMPRIKPGKDIPCLKCGKHHAQDASGECRYCNGSVFLCDCCGKELSPGDVRYYDLDGIYCEKCTEEKFNLVLCRSCMNWKSKDEKDCPHCKEKFCSYHAMIKDVLDSARIGIAPVITLDSLD